MAVQDISEKRLQEATGKSWQRWLEVFESINAKELDHKAIVKKIAEVTYVNGWWLQMVTVKYEQHIGRRKKGQEKDGTYTMGAGKVVNGTMDDIFANWQEAATPGMYYNGQKMVTDPKPTSSEKWRYWRAEMSDGTKTVVGIHQMKPGKVGFAVDQQKCTSEAHAKEWKAFWRTFVDKVFITEKSEQYGKRQAIRTRQACYMRAKI